MADSRNPSRVDRRGFLTFAGVGAGIVAAGAVGSRVAKGAPSEPPPPPAHPGPPDDAVAALFGDLVAGGALGDCRIERVYGLHQGAIPVVMTCSAGTRFQLDILRRDPSGPAGVGNTDTLSVYVANQGDGHSPTRESQGVAAMELAAFLAERGASPPPGLFTLDQRRARFDHARFAVAL